MKFDQVCSQNENKTLQKQLKSLKGMDETRFVSREKNLILKM
jgi:cell division protein FtsX